MSHPCWYESLKKWIAQPSPTGEWLYRGQHLKYKTILPSILRNKQKKYYGQKLYKINTSISYAIFNSLLGFSGKDLYPYQAICENELQIELLNELTWGFPSDLTWIAQSEIVQALAQHYGYPTSFVDLTLDPLVALFFATHTNIGGHYEVRPDDIGIIYRWPAIRKSNCHMEIRLENKKTNYGDSIKGIDISSINKYIHRPWNQKAVMVMPILRYCDLFSPEAISPYCITLLEDLETIDISELPNCDSYELPAGIGDELDVITGISAEAMFPDQIDLGYSILAVIAYLSTAIGDLEPPLWHIDKSDELYKAWNVYKPDADKLYKEALFTGYRILERECFRLIPDYPVTDSLSRFSAIECDAVFSKLLDNSRKACKNLKENEKIKRQAEMLRKDICTPINKSINKRIDIYNEIFNKKKKQFTIEDIGFHWIDSIEWIPAEIERRYDVVKAVISKAGNIPVYALENENAYKDFFDIFPSTPEYEGAVKKQLNAFRLWGTTKNKYTD